jgi:MFS family permease
MNRPRRLFNLPREVWLLGWVSLFTDTATEMIYPLLPLFLTRVIGASAMSLGVIEGIAEAANSALKILSGRLADKWGAAKPLVLFGYGLSSAVRPLIGLASSWLDVLTLRFADRLGKGVRGAPRDAMLVAYADATSRGRVFGFHRAMDHAGAVLGPLVAAAFLYFYPADYRTLFALTVIPGIIVMLVLWRVPERRTPGTPGTSGTPGTPGTPGTSGTLGTPGTPGTSGTPGTIGTPGTPGTLSNPFYKFIALITLFSLGNASDAFLLLRLNDIGLAAFWIPLLWSGLHVVKVGSSIVGGTWSDRFGRRRLIAAGWIVYAFVYAGFAIFDQPLILIAIFLSYGVYFGLTEGVERAWIADLAPASAQGVAFGIYYAAIGLGSLVASLLFGFIWTRVSPEAAFHTGAGIAIAAILLLYLMFSRSPDAHPGYQR